MERTPINSVLLRRIKEPVGVADGQYIGYGSIRMPLVDFLTHQGIKHHLLENLYEDTQAAKKLAACPTLAFHTTYTYREKTDTLLKAAADLPDLWTVIVLGETAYCLAARAILQRDAEYARRREAGGRPHAPAIELIGFDSRAWESWHEHQVNSGEAAAARYSSCPAYVGPIPVFGRISYISA